MDFSKVIKWTIGGKEVKMLQVNGQIYWQKADPVDYFYVEDISGAENEINFKSYVNPKPTINIEYSMNAKDWQTWSNPYTEKKTIPANGKLFMRGTNNVLTYAYLEFLGNCNVGGDLTCLLEPNGGVLDLTGKEECFFEFFYDNKKLINAKDLILPSNILSNKCYQSLFQGCTSMVTAPILSATTLAPYCYGGMFGACFALTTPPELPAMTLADYCYTRMFTKCKNLINAPELPAETLAPYCYDYMFSGCTILNNINIGATTWDETNSENWLSDVSATGNIIAPNLTWDNFPNASTSGVPTGWTLNGEARPKVINTFYVEDVSGGANEVWFTKGYQPTKPNLEYSTDNRTWTTWSDPYNTHIPIQPNSRVYLRGTNNSIGQNLITTTANFDAGGDITTLLEPNGGIVDLSGRNFVFARLFEKSKVINAEKLDLVSTKLTEYCYASMFNESSIEKAPTILVERYNKRYCNSMFYNCINLKYIEINAKFWQWTYSQDWVSGVPSGGTFVKPTELIVGDGDSLSGQIPMGDNGIPSGWEIIDK